MLDQYEQEQVDRIRDWWQRHGAKALLGVTVMAVAAAAGSVWHYYQARQLAAAGQRFGDLQMAAAAGNADKVRALAADLIAHYGQTPQAVHAALLAARVNHAHGDDRTAIAQLDWAAAHADTAGLRDLARLREAAILLDDKKPDAALAKLGTAETPAFAPLYLDLAGDIQMAAGRTGDARTDWQAALARTAAGSPAHALIQMKIDQLG